MITEIGIVAGEIWHYLDGHGKSSLSDIIKGIDKPKDIALMSIGWLAREGHVIVEKEGRDYKVQLRSK
ncbi:MAG: winged helix-turn-helix domain-containing protein [Candidatus Omnitrophica bacterium]|nr:winged helix-turn-helix domain-containing protein [Candidatus Omnitrophota bacterium]